MIKLFTIRGGKVNVLGITKAMIMAIITSGIVVSIAAYFKISEDEIWKFIALIQQQLGIEFGEDLNQKFRNEEKLLDFIIKNKVDQAIYEYERLTGDYGTPRIPLPRLIESPIDTYKCYTKECKSLGGEMRLCSPWMPDCTGGVQPVDKDQNQ
jgi:hypothetical protein